MGTFEGNFTAGDARFALVVGRFNSLFTQQLLAGCQDALTRHGVAEDHVDVVWVPGAMEIPLTCKKLAATGRYGAVVALGAVIRGGTNHYDLVCKAVADGVAQASLDTGVPVVFGVITTDNLEQAMERSGTKAGNKGFDAGLTALEMVDLHRRLAE